MTVDGLTRCTWVGSDPVMIAYHDREWGVPVYDDRQLFEALVLSGAQAGLSWAIILRKREHYRAAFAGFDPGKVACYDETHVARLLANPGIVRNRLKISSAIVCALKVLEIQAEHGSLASYLWQFVGGRPIRNDVVSIAQIPARSPESERMSSELRRRGLTFVGPTICYAFMQAVGMVNDHLVDCFRRGEG